MSGIRRSPVFDAKALLHVIHTLPSATSYIVGFSGGADSTALLHAMKHIQEHLGAGVRAIHVNHGLNHDADVWQAHCENFCHRHDIPIRCFGISLTKSTGKGLEAEARTLRYKVISDELRPGTALLTAHHADDQAETLLLNLMRGSGVDGLSSMPESRSLGSGLLQRPLLEFSNDTLVDYLQKHELQWIEDPSNQFLNHDRNFMRHKVIPLLARRWQGINKRLLLTRHAMVDARILLERLADKHLKEHLIHPMVLGLSASFLDDRPLFNLVLRRWAQRAGANPVPAYQLQSFASQLAHSDNQQMPELCWGGWRIRLFQNKLWFFEALENPETHAHRWPATATEIDLGNDTGRLVITEQQACETSKNNLQEQTGVTRKETGKWLQQGLEVCTRCQVKKTEIRLGGHHKALKKIFQASGIPPWLRDHIPICQRNEKIVAIGDWCFDDVFGQELKTRKLGWRWYPQHPLLQFIRNRQHLGAMND